MKKYKLTDQNLRTHNLFQWKVGVPAPELDGEGDLCSDSWYHYYHDPLLAVFMNPVHADIEDPIGWEVSATGKCKDDNGLKGGCTKMKLVKEIALPTVTRTQRIAFAILCAKEVYKDEKWNLWAENWLSGKDRSAAAAASSAAAYAASSAAAYAAAYAAHAASSASSAAHAAAAAAESGNWNFKKLLSIAEKAMRY